LAFEFGLNYSYIFEFVHVFAVRGKERGKVGLRVIEAIKVGLG